VKALTLSELGGPQHLVVQEVPPPRLEAPDQVLVRVRAAALNRLDLFVADGLPGITYNFPHVVGSDGAGSVEATGPEVAGFKPGDRVMFNPGIACQACEWCLAGEHPLCTTYQLLGEHRPGTIAEYVVVPARNLARVPDAMTWDQAAAFSLATLSAWRMLVNRAALQAGESVLVWGVGGGVSLAAVQVARLVGARVIATSSSAAKLAVASRLGADVTINHAEVDVAKEVRRLTGRRGVEVVVDSVGEKTWEQSLRCLARLGRLVTCGATTGPMVVTDIRKLFWYQWTILGSTMGSEGEYRRIVELAHQGKLWPVVDSVVPLDQAIRAFERLQAGAQTGKLVIEVTRE
jgi:NADPH:quinone reductase-like Zn-dependent oxidoreductase